MVPKLRIMVNKKAIKEGVLPVNTEIFLCYLLALDGSPDNGTDDTFLFTDIRVQKNGVVAIFVYIWILILLAFLWNES